MKAHLPHLAPALLLSLIAAACSSSEPQAAPAEEGSAPMTTSSLLDLGIPNAVVFEEHLASSGQPTQEQFAALPSAGYTHVVSARPATEQGSGWEEEAAKAIGITFVRIPVAGPDDLNEENAQALDRALQEAGEANVLVACGSGNRVGGLFAMRAYFLQGKTPEDALEYGRKAGLTKLEPAVRAKLGL